MARHSATGFRHGKRSVTNVGLWGTKRTLIRRSLTSVSGGRPEVAGHGTHGGHSVRQLVQIGTRSPSRHWPAKSAHCRGLPQAYPHTNRKRRWEIEMDDRTVRVALERHWDASDASDFKVEHEIYREDAVLDYPQSGERIRGRQNIQESRFVQPSKKRFTVRRIIGSGDLWVTEFVLTYDGIPSCAVSIMEFRDGLVASETQYFTDRFDPSPTRSHLVERTG